MAEMNERGLLIEQRVSLGWQAGARGGAKMKLFQTGALYPLRLEVKRHYYFVSVWATELTARGFIIEGYDASFGSLGFSRGPHGKQVDLVMVVDDLSCTAEEVVLRFLEAQKHFAGARVKLHVYTDDRFRVFAEKIGLENVKYWLPTN